jgi:hypothetical protein
MIGCEYLSGRCSWAGISVCVYAAVRRWTLKVVRCIKKKRPRSGIRTKAVSESESNIDHDQESGPRQ